MRFSTIVLITGAMTAAAPALAQNTTTPNANASGNTVSTAGSTENAVAGTNEATPTTTAATPGTQTAAVPEAAPPANNAPPSPGPQRRSFPWGVLGLLGLIGL